VQWRETQDRVKMEMLRRQFGIAEPVRRGMELKITQAGEWRPAALGRSSGVHKDILEGRDTEIGWEDVFTGMLKLTLGDSRGGLNSRVSLLTPFYRQRAPRSTRLPYRNRGEDEDELVVVSCRGNNCLKPSMTKLWMHESSTLRVSMWTCSRLTSLTSMHWAGIDVKINERNHEQIQLLPNVRS